MLTARDRSLHRGLEDGKAEMRLLAADQRPWQRYRGRIAVPCELLDRGAPGIAKAEQLGGLVEGLAGGIVDGRREPLIIAHAANFEQLAVAAARKQQQVGECERAVDEPRA